MWLCHHCRASLPGEKKVIFRIASLEQKQSEMLECMNGFTGGDIDKLITEKVSEKFREVRDKEHEIESRKLNLVVFGIPEFQGVSTDARLTDDQSKLNSICKRTCIFNPILLRSSRAHIELANMINQRIGPGH